MNGQVSLLNKKLSEQPEKKTSGVKVYIEDADGNSYSTRLTSDAMTIEDAILQAVRNFNKNIHAELPENPHLFELYAAKNGKKDTGLPSFEKSQPLNKVGKERFFLVCLSKEFRLLSNQSLPSVKPFSMDMGGDKEKKEESVSEKGGFCFCGGW